MRFFLASLLLAALAVYTSAQVIGFGCCPDIRPVADLDEARLAGRWYEIARFYTSYEDGASCLASDFVLNAGMDELDRYFSVTISGIDGEGNSFISEETARQEQGRIDFADDEWGAYTIGAVTYEDEIWFHGCRQYFWGLFNVQYNWIFAREPTRTEEQYQHAVDYLASQGINVDRLIRSDQRDCKTRQNDVESFDDE